jgi:hypothetical protein
MLAAMFSGRHQPAPRSSDGRHFIDRDGDLFRYVLRYMRDGDLDVEDLDQGLRKQLMREAAFYCLPGLEKKLKRSARRALASQQELEQEQKCESEPEGILLGLHETDPGVFRITGQHPAGVPARVRSMWSTKAPSYADAVAKLTAIYHQAGYRLTTCVAPRSGLYVLFHKKKENSQ